LVELCGTSDTTVSNGGAAASAPLSELTILVLLTPGSSTGGQGPSPLTTRSLLRMTVAICPTLIVVIRSDATDCTDTAPRSTVTEAPSLSELTMKCVPLTTAARYGVCTSKCLTRLASASTSTRPT